MLVFKIELSLYLVMGEDNVCLPKKWKTLLAELERGNSYSFWSIVATGNIKGHTPIENPISMAAGVAHYSNIYSVYKSSIKSDVDPFKPCSIISSEAVPQFIFGDPHDSLNITSKQVALPISKHFPQTSWDWIRSQEMF